MPHQLLHMLFLTLFRIFRAICKLTIVNMIEKCFSTLIWCALTLNQPGSGKSVNYRGPFSFDLAFMCKLTSPGMWQMCNRALRFWEFAQNGAAILLYLERVRPDWESPPSTLYTSQDEKLIGMLPSATPHCRPRLVGLLPRLGGLL